MKKSKLSLILIFILIAVALFGNKAYAANTMNLNITDSRPYTNKKYTVTTPNANVHTVFKIIKNNGVNYVWEDALYCLRSGLGFGNSENVNNLNADGRLDEDVLYTETYNLKTDATAVMNYYNTTIGYNIQNPEYNSILWIIDNMYLPEHKDAAEMKDNLIKNVLAYDGGNNVSEEQLQSLTDDDIEFVQQMALWYFSNYDDNGGQNSLSLADTYVLSNTTKIDEEALTEDKQRAIDNLYKYFVENAKKHVTDYGIGTTRDFTYIKPQITVNDTSRAVTTDGNFKVIGPFSITKQEGNVNYDLSFEIKDKNGQVIPEKDEDVPVVYVVANPTDMVPSVDSVDQTIGNGDFYLKISNLYATTYDLTDVTIEPKITYEKLYKTTATLWLGTAEDQPVVKVDKEEVIEGDFNIVIEKVDEDGNLLFGATFTMQTEDRELITIINNGDGTFSVPNIPIKENGQEFIYEIEEISAPSGYIKINGAIKVKITTKLNETGDRYILDKAEFINATGEPIVVDNVTIDVVDNTVTFTVVNEKSVDLDLALRKFITKINGEYITSRVPKIDTSKLNTIDQATGKTITTAKYTHSKEPVIVKQGDIVTFTLRIYNEGEVDGYATKIADYIPEGLGYLMNYKTNTDNFWVPVADHTTKTIDLVGTEGFYKTEEAVKNLKVTDFYETDSLSDVKIVTGKAKISSTALEDEIIKAYNKEIKTGDIDASDKWQQSTNGTDGLYYRDIEISCIVLAENSFKGTLKNIAEIQEDKAVDEQGEEIVKDDRDSTPDNVDSNNYNAPEDNSSYQEDDDDYEPMELRCFDLALRKFITKINDDDVTTRIPKPTVDTDGKIKYEHDKTPVYVANSDIVTYTIRVYNEGSTLGYAMEVSDDIPDGLVFLPTHDTNKQYKWKMLDSEGKETDDPQKAVEIRTTYLENTLLKPYDPTKAISETEPYNPDYAEVKVAFQVIEEEMTQEDRIIINKAQITKDKAVDEEGNEIDIDDIDSIPDEWNEGEDDQDIEKIYVKYFDLALLKWVTQTRVTVDGKTITTDTGFTPYDDPEPIAKVVIDKNKLSKTTVKFVYNIIIMNQGEIPGYATEITDYIPEGLEFVAEDNPLWTKESGNKITTRALEGKLLNPGDSATVEVIFTWKNGAENLGLKTNIAEISEDYNDKGSKDIDSTPDNVKTDDYDKQQEDDDDKALVILEIKTGGSASYIWLGLVVLTILAGGVLLIKKFVI